MGKAVGIILAGGTGRRMGAEQPKQYLKLLGKEVISYSIDAFNNSKMLDDYYVVLDHEEFQAKRIQSRYGVKTILGGSSRNESFQMALEYIYRNVGDCEKLFVNEAARPMITPQIIDDFLSKLDKYNYIYSAAKITDSLETIDKKYANRDEYILVRSPEAYHFKEIYQYFKSDTKTSFPGHTLPEHYSSYRYFEYKDNFKLTYPEDITLIERILSEKQIK